MAASITPTTDSYTSTDSLGEVEKKTTSQDHAVQSAAQKAIKERGRSLKRVLLIDHKGLHGAVDSSPLITRLKEETIEKAEYMQFLVNLKHDMGLLESLLEEHKEDQKLNKIHLSLLYRSKALDNDIQNLGIPETKVSLLMLTYQHEKRFEQLSKKGPYLLAAHAIVWYLGVLFGGQKQMERVRGLWDKKAPIEYYQVPGEVNKIRRNVFKQIGEFEKSLTDNEYCLFVDELKCAWEFAGDVLGNDIRKV